MIVNEDDCERSLQEEWSLSVIHTESHEVAHLGGHPVQKELQSVCEQFQTTHGWADIETSTGLNCCKAGSQK